MLTNPCGFFSGSPGRQSLIPEWKQSKLKFTEIQRPARDENTPQVENRTIASTKTTLTILWNPHGFHVVIMLAAGESFKASWFIDQNLIPLVKRFFPSDWSPR
jgi:hypothetical protein